MNFNSLIPELSVTDINKSTQFYLSIGFAIKYERPEDNFCFLELENNQIMIEQINENWNTGTLEYPFGRGINISMSVSNVNELYDKIINRNIKPFKKIETHSYRVDDVDYEDTEFLIQDPDGYLLRFNN